MEFMFVCIGLLALSFAALTITRVFELIHAMKARTYNMEHAAKTHDFIP